MGTQLRIAIAETTASKDQCKACQREGLPILPLRHALVPRSPSDPLGPEPLHIDTRPGLRTLRAGYLYVLLDRTIWHAYQVTPDGYLRQFNPYAPAPANDTSLGEACVSANHDCPASFLNIDTHKHTQAWLAFASDPWPISVLDAYKAGHASERFHKLDLASARDNPASVGLAMTDENLQVDKQVYEYQQTQLSATTGSDWRFYQHSAQTGFHSVHGFHSRAHRLSALKGFLRNVIPQHNLQQGVLAFVLDDTIGLVQEFNNTRNGWIQKRQDWMSDPDRAYQYQTSQLLLAIREVHRERAENTTPLPAFVEPVTGDGPLYFPAPRLNANGSFKSAPWATTKTLRNATTSRAAPGFTGGMSRNAKNISITSIKADTLTRQRVAPCNLCVSSKMTTTAMIVRRGGPTARPWRCV
ncbi:T6SS effector BTH_I2691 family protein [Pseudomonas fluorescens]|nr:T6SS effector BTH_I2691 family protein [Pseudomonas fluorescens]